MSSTSQPWAPAAARSPAPGAEAAGAGEQLRWFATLWVMALAFHYSDSQPLAVLPVLLVGMPVLAFPSAVPAFALFLGTGAVIAALNLPAASNHLVLSLLTTAALAGAAAYARRPSGGDPFAARWLDTARTPAGLVLLVVYAFTVFDKLNTAFFDPATSCAGALLGRVVTLDTGPAALSPDAVAAAAAGTVLVEAAILVLVAVPGWRRWGLALGVGFHAFLAPASFYDFATVVYALYVLLAPPAVFADLASRPRLRRVALAGFGAHVLVSLGAAVSGAAGPLPRAMLLATWYVAVGAFMVPLVRACLTSHALWPRWRPRPWLLLLVPLLAFANGTMPYLGLKTVASYSMFSNLHTEEGRTNHLVPGLTALELVPYQRDTVAVTALQLPVQARLALLDLALGGSSYVQRAARWASEPPPVRIPWLELRRTVLLWRDAGLRGVELVYVRDGVPHAVDDATTDPELAAPMPWWQRQLLAFRAIDSASGGDRCRW